MLIMRISLLIQLLQFQFLHHILDVLELLHIFLDNIEYIRIMGLKVLQRIDML